MDINLKKVFFFFDLIFNFKTNKKFEFNCEMNFTKPKYYADANLKLANYNIELLHEAFLNGVADNQDMILGENDMYDNQARYFNELLQLMLSEIEGRRVVGLFNEM